MGRNVPLRSKFTTPGPERDPRSKYWVINTLRSDHTEIVSRSTTLQLGRMHEQQGKHPPNWTTQQSPHSIHI